MYLKSYIAAFKNSAKALYKCGGCCCFGNHCTGRAIVLMETLYTEQKPTVNMFRLVYCSRLHHRSVQLELVDYFCLSKEEDNKKDSLKCLLVLLRPCCVELYYYPIL